MGQYEEEAPEAVRVPADVGRADTILGPLTARQVALLAVAAGVLYGGYWLARPFMAPLTYLVMVVPVSGAVVAVVLGKREGIGLDRFLLAGLAHARTAKRRVHAPEGVAALPEAVPRRLAEAAGPVPVAMEMPYAGVAEPGVLDLRGDGRVALAVCSTVNFDLRSGAEQQGLVAAFARWLNSLTGPTQLLVRCHRIELAPLAAELHHGAGGLSHPALEQAARAHADFLTELAAGGDLLGRQVVLAAREEESGSRSRRTALGERATQRVHEATRTLSGAEITVTPINTGRTADLVASACNPDTAQTPVSAEGGGEE